MGDLLNGYAPIAAFDELFASAETPRPHALALHDALQTLSPADFADRCAARDRAFRDQGITFQQSGEERPFPLDLVPRVIAADEWAVIERGVRQRVLALEAFLDDVYGAGRIITERVIPRRLVITSRHYHRQVAGIRPPRGVRVHVSGVDLVRDAHGQFRVLEDNLRVPSGISYVIENRRAMTRVFPELFASHRVCRVDAYPARLLDALRQTAPEGIVDPCVVVLTPGVHNAAYFEHSFLARQMGVELVEGSDLVCQDETLFMRTTGGLQRVDVVYRRVDDDYLDPLLFRPESIVGCAGLLHTARAGRVTIANAAGNGVADDKAVYPYVPEMIRFYLQEEPILANVETYRLGDPDVCAWVLTHLDQLVVKPVDGAGGYGIVIGPQADDRTLSDLGDAIRADPRGYVAQDPIALSTAPTFVGGAMEPRHLDLRPFAIHDGDDVWVAPGGLTRVALRKGSLVVNSSQGGGSKDTWVLADPDQDLGGSDAAPDDDPETRTSVRGASPAVCDPPAPGPFRGGAEQ